MERQIAIILCTISLIFVGCSSIGGLYVHSYEHPTLGYVEQNLWIEKNHSFIYKHGKTEYPLYDSTIGDWGKKRNHLILNSEFQDTTEFYITESMDITFSLDSIRVKVFDLITKEPVNQFGVILILNENNFFSYYPTDEKGESKIPKKFLQITFPYISTRYCLKDRKNNVLTLYIRQRIYFDFVNEIYRIENDKLIHESNDLEYEYIRQK